MGGQAFADEKPPRYTPRMPLAVYTHTRDQLLSTLRSFYAQAECPIEAPGKTDYGDIDILVAEPLHVFDLDRISTNIGAVKHKTQAGSPTTHFALPWPKNLPPEPPSPDSTSNAGPCHNDSEAKYIQLDLHLCTASSLQWELFHQAHGDLWNIIGSHIRRLGLTPANSGLYIRIEEIETRNKIAARVLLTTSPSQTLRFLGLDEERYWRRFESVDGLFAYAASCRFFDPRRYADPERTKRELKANDRARTRKRPVFRSWFHEYLPAHVNQEPPDAVAATMSRAEVVEEAKGWFGIRDEYDEKRRKGLQEINREKMWTRIRKESGIEEESIGAVVRAVKREVAGVLETAEHEHAMHLTALQRAYAAEDGFDAVVRWVRDHWREMAETQRAYEKEKSTAHLLAKLERLRAEGKADGSTRLGRAGKEVQADGATRDEQGRDLNAL